MANALDLLSPTVRDLRQEQNDEETQTMQLARMTPEQQMAYMAISSGRGIGKGLGQAAGGLFGVDTRSETERYVDAVKKVKDAVAAEGIDPTDLDKFYPRVIQLLAQNRLPAEAAAMHREYQKMKREDAAAARQDADLKRKETMDRARAGDMTARAQIAREKLATMGSPFMQAVNRLEQLSKQFEAASPDTPESRSIEAAYNAVVKQLDKMSAGKVAVVNTGDKVQIIDNETGEVVREITKGVSPDAQLRADTAESKADAKKEAADAQQVAAYKSSKDKLQGIYDNVVALANHPGLGNITGRVLGAIGGESGKGGVAANMALSDEGRAALALLEQVTGQAFLGALEQLKQASKNGASGLGSVTEREGDRVIAASAALNRQQDTGTFIKSLKRYAATIEQMAERMDEKAGTEQLVPLRKAPVSPAGEAPQRRATDKPAAAPAEPKGKRGLSDIFGK